MLCVACQSGAWKKTVGANGIFFAEDGGRSCYYRPRYSHGAITLLSGRIYFDKTNNSCSRSSEMVICVDGRLAINSINDAANCGGL